MPTPAIDLDLVNAQQARHPGPAGGLYPQPLLGQNHPSPAFRRAGAVRGSG